jgi:RND family efflux transporter MFP subunit
MKFIKLKIGGLFVCSMLIFSACSNGVKKIENPLKVDTFKITETSVKKGLYYSGTIEAGQNISLSFLTMGTVDKVNAREGDKVTKGQLLAQLDSQSSQNALQIAQAKASQAEDAFKRFQPMYEHGNLPEIKMIEIKTAKKQSELSVKLAEKNYKDCYLYAPATGFISQKNIESGDNVIPGKTAMKFVTVDKVYAVISIPEKEIQKIKKGMDATVELAENNNQIKGQVTDVGVSADVFSRTYTVRILIKNSNVDILPGMLCNVYISSNDKSSAIIIPATAIKIDETNQEYVYVVDINSKKVNKKYVKSNGFVQGGILISSGLDINDVIVSQGVQKLDDNTSVEF